MGKLSSNLAETAPARSPERQRLADAIENLAQAKDALSHIQNVQSFQLDKAIQADRALHEAFARLEELGADDARALAAAALGDDASSRTLRDARDAVEAARRQVELCDVTRQGLREREEEAEKSVASAETSLRGAYLVAVSSDDAVLRLIGKYEAKRRELATLALAMKECEAFFPHNYVWDQYAKNYHDLDASQLGVWRSALAALKLDPDVELP